MSFASARKCAGISQIEVAEKIGVNQSAVCLWEKGKTNPRAALLPKLAELYHCTIEELLAPEDSDQEEKKVEIHEITARIGRAPGRDT